MGVAELLDALPTSVSGEMPDGDKLRTELVAGVVGFIAGDASIVDGVVQIDPADADLGGVRQAYVYGSDAGVFVYDALDETTEHDGIFCLVLIGGRRYKRVGTPTLASVKSRAVTTPPDPADSDPSARPQFGDAYLYLTGSWGGKGIAVNAIAIWSSLGGGSWQGVAPAYGPPVWVQDEKIYIHWEGGDGWVDGVGGRAYPDVSIPPSALIWDNRVENQTTNSPPSTWSKGVAYIAGPSAVSPWSAGKIYLALTDGILANGDSFEEMTPYAGQEVYDIALAQFVVWSSAATAWVKVASGYGAITTATASAAASLAGATTNSSPPFYNFSATTAPTNVNDKSVITEALTASVMADYAGQAFEIDYQASLTAALGITHGSSGAYSRIKVIAAIYVDSETTARDWQLIFDMTQTSAASVDLTLAQAMRPVVRMLQMTLGDTSSHTITIRFHIWDDNAVNNMVATTLGVARRTLRIRKIS